MALRMRNTITTNRTANEENATGIGKEKSITLRGLPKRAVLGEIGNVQTRSKINGIKDGAAKKKEITKPTTTTLKQTGTLAVRQTKSTQQSTQSLICKTSTLLKPSKPVLRPPPITSITSIPGPSSLAATRPPVGGIKPRIKLPLQKTVSTSSLIVTKQTFGSSRLTVPSVPKNSGFRDIDKEAESNPILVGEYAGEIYAFMREIEVKYLVKNDFLQGQQVNAKMRAIVVDWLVEVQLQYSLLLETLHLAIGIFDRFLNNYRDITRTKLQLVGVTSMWIASKYEELFSPELENFVYITDRAYDKKEIMKMERLMHKTLDFCYGQPLAIHFLRRYSNASEANPKHHTYAKYFLEIALLSYPLRPVRPSLLAAVALYISLCVVNDKNPSNEIWTDCLIFYSTYSFSDLKPHVPVLAQAIISAESSKLQAVQRKYSSTKQLKVSSCVYLKSDILNKLATLNDDDEVTEETKSVSTK